MYLSISVHAHTDTCVCHISNQRKREYQLESGRGYEKDRESGSRVITFQQKPYFIK